MAGKDKRANGSAADDAEFEKLLDEMDELGRQADALRAKVNHLIDEMRENDVPPDEEAGEAAGEESGEAADGVPGNVPVDEEADGDPGDVPANDESDGNPGDEPVGEETDDVAVDAADASARKTIDENEDPGAK